MYICRGSLLHSPHDSLQSCQAEILRRPCVVSCKWISKHANQSFVMLIISLMGFLPWLCHFMVQKHLWSVRSWCAIFFSLVYCWFILLSCIGISLLNVWSYPRLQALLTIARQPFYCIFLTTLERLQGCSITLEIGIWNFSATIKWIAVKFHIDIHGP